MIKRKESISITFGLVFDSDYTYEQLSYVKDVLDKELDVNLSTEYLTTLVSFKDFSSIDEFSRFYLEKLSKVSKEYGIDIDVHITKATLSIEAG